MTGDHQGLYSRIGGMLESGGLDPSPAHYDFCHAYLVGSDPAFVARVDEGIRQHGGFSAQVLAQVGRGYDAKASQELNAMIAQAHQHLEQISGLVDRSGSQTHSYGEALQSNASRLAAGSVAEPIVQDLVRLTQTMIEQSREVQEQLRATGDEVRQMREGLEEARRNANTDALTGLPNRRALDAELKAAMGRSRGGDSNFSLAICDIDHFKRFNDEHGHPVGDSVLKLVASRLAGGDHGGRIFVSRYGGEEFVMLFDGVSPAAAADTVDKIRSDLAARDLSLSESGQRLGRLSFSAGIAGFHGHRSTSSVLKSADTALYEAKRLGRNQVCIAA